MNVLVVGYQGTMGQVVRTLATKDADLSLTGLGIANDAQVFLRIEDAPLPDVILDFSIPSALNSYLDYAIDHRIPCVIATTGYSVEQEARIQRATQHIPVFKSANFSLGVQVLKRLIELATPLLSDMSIDVFEAHHARKLDAPSGTAKALIETITQLRALQVREQSCEARQADTVYVHVERRGAIVGEHRIVYTDDQESLEITHRAHSKEVFAKGALHAVRWVVHQGPGYYTMEDVWKTM